MNQRERQRFRRLVGIFYWRKAVMPCYYNCPHEYVVRQADLFVRGAPWRITEQEFRFLKKVIDKHGEQVKWRHRKDIVLFDGLYSYWRCGGVINRTYRNDGKPSAKVLKRLRKRFWPTTADRRYYNCIVKYF